MSTRPSLTTLPRKSARGWCGGVLACLWCKLFPYCACVLAHRASPCSEPLTVKDMTEMGLKITGQTGEAKLKVLRQLKLIVMNKQGVSMGRPY
eukprot:m.27688 g.27688  ORF g.27688 m.27688 type:complete len:93 (-) comp4812_c0_seq1:65-343(-)